MRATANFLGHDDL